MLVALLLTLLIGRPGGRGKGSDLPIVSDPFPKADDRQDRPLVKEQDDLLKRRIKKVGFLTQLTKSAVSGSAHYGTSTVLYIEKSTGHLYKINLDGSDQSRLSNTTLPKSFETIWSPKSDKMAVRYYSDPSLSGEEIKLAIKTVLIPIGHLINSAGVVDSELNGTALSPNTFELAASPTEDKIFYLSRADDSTEGAVIDFEGKNQKKIFELPFGEFNVSWPTKDTIALLTKPSFRADGYLYFLNQNSGQLTKILGGLKGLAASISRNGENLVFSFVSDNGLRMNLYDLKNKNFSDLDFKTLADKCVWGIKNKNIIYCAVPRIISGSGYPDKWYQGGSAFDDDIWSKNVETGENNNLLEHFGADIIDLRLSAKEDYITFTDKNDGTIWSLMLEE